jgi:hypothetical protein
VEDRRVLEAVLPAAAQAADRLEAAGWGSCNASALRLSLTVYRKGWAKAPAGLDSGTARAAGFEAATLEPAGADPTSAAGFGVDHPLRPFLFSSHAWETITEALSARASQPGLMLRADAEAVAAIKEDALQAVLARMIGEGSLVKSGSGWTVPGKSTSLSPEEAEVLQRLKAAGKAGLEPGKSTSREDARLLKALCTAGAAVPLDGPIFIARSIWEEAIKAILTGCKPGDRFSVPMAKERSGLSRKYILPLLNRMEDHGLVKRSGDERIVIKVEH